MLKSVKLLYYQKFYIHLLNNRNLHMVKMIIKLLYIIPYSIPGLIFAYILTKTDNVLVTAGIHTFHNGILMSIQFLTMIFM